MPDEDRTASIAHLEGFVVGLGTRAEQWDRLAEESVEPVLRLMAETCAAEMRASIATVKAAIELMLTQDGSDATAEALSAMFAANSATIQGRTIIINSAAQDYIDRLGP